MVNNVEVRLVESLSEVSFGNCHTDCHGQTCAQRTCRCVDTCCVTVFRVTRCLRIHLTELLKILDGQTAYTKQVQKRIIKSRAVTAGKYEAVSIDPLRILRVKVHFLAPERVSHSSGTERKTRVAGVGLLNHIRGKNTDSGDCILFNLCTHIPYTPFDEIMYTRLGSSAVLTRVSDPCFPLFSEEKGNVSKSISKLGQKNGSTSSLAL